MQKVTVNMEWDGSVVEDFTRLQSRLPTGSRPTGPASVRRPLNRLTRLEH
jgi:hypothetical protein